MSGAGAEHESKPKDVSWTTRDLLLFAHSIGATVDELHLIYVGASSSQSHRTAPCKK